MAGALVASAEEALRLAHADPGRARELASWVIPRARAAGDDRAASTAERALGQVASGLEDLLLAARHLRRALRLAARAGDETRTAEARMSLALVLTHQGRGGAALRELDKAAPVLRGRDAGRLLNQRATVLYHLGRLDEALADFERGMVISRRVGDRLNEARMLCNRGVVHAARGAYPTADRDLRRADTLAGELGQRLMVAGIHQNLGWLAGLRGDLADALAWYDRAEEEYRPHCEPLGTLLLDRCQLLLSARLLAEAAEAARRAVDAFERGRLDTSRAEAELALGEVALQAGDATTALAAARAAASAFRRQRRPAWVALARYAEVRARLLAAPSPSPAHRGRDAGQARRTARKVADQLERAGWAAAAADVRVAAARLALEAGEPAAARRDLASAAAARHRGTVETRTRAWHAEALLRLAEGNRRGARGAVHTGLRILEQHRAALGATDLRAAISTHQVELARLAVGLAVEDGRAAEALAWTERTRAAVLRYRSARPADDSSLAADLAALRATVAEVEEATREQRPTGALLRRQATLERSVRDRSRRVAASSVDLPAPPPTPAELAARLDGRALVEYVDLNSDLYALTFVGGRARLYRLGPAAQVHQDAERQLFVLRQLATGAGSVRSRQAAAAALRGLAVRLDACLFGPLRRTVGDRPLVVVPTADLSALAWSTLPSCRGRAVTVAPSATSWFGAAARGAAGDAHAAVVAGPGLPGADREAATIAASYPNAALLAGSEARVSAVLSALDGAHLAHLAAHGVPRADNPLFTSLRLADGPLTVYDLERLERAPLRVVLSACDMGRPDMRPGEEMLGLAAALLAVGSQSLVASVVGVPDEAAVPVMVALHRRLARGQEMGAALADVQLHSATVDSDPATLAAAAGFVCLGAA